MIPTLAAAFANPPAVYRPMMFWAWNGEVTRDRIDHDLAEMKAKGCGGFFIHPMGESFRLHDFLQGQSPPYLSDEYFALVKYAVERAEAEGLYAWLYDEGGWPSGTAQGHVIEGHPEFRGKVLTAHVGPETPEGDVVATLLLRQGEAPQVLAHDSPGPDGAVIHFVMRPGGFPVDMLDPAAVRRFIDVTHERYREYVGEHFGGTVPGMFTDEPRVGGRVGSKEVMWTPAMLAAFEQDHGYDLRPYLPLLFSRDALGIDASAYYPEGATEAVRCAFFDTWTRLHREAYWDQLNAWCEAHNLLHVGHVGGEDTLPDHIGGGFGEFFRTAGTLDVPGVDAIWRQLWPDKPKLHYPLVAASAAHQQPSASSGTGGPPVSALPPWPRTGLALTESFGVYGFGLDFAGMKWVTDYQFVRGINVMCPMAYSMYTEGGRLYRTLDYMGPGNPLWEHYAACADYVGRLSLVGRAGESAASIAVYYPIEALWASAAGDAPGSFETICGLLEDRQVEFDTIGGDAVLQASVEDGMLVTPGAAYELLILPEMGVLRRSVAEKLSQFRAGGGRVAFLGDGPASVIDGPSLRPAEEAVPGLLEGAFSVDIPKELDTLVAAFGGQSARSMVLEFDGFSAAFKGSPWLHRFAGRRLAPGVALTVPRDNLGPFAEIMGATATRVHLGLNRPVEGLRLMTRLLDQSSIHLLVNERDEDREVRLLLTSDQALRLDAWDPETGALFVLAEHTDISEVTPVELSLRPHRSLVLVVAPPDALPPPTREAPSEWPVREALGSLGPPEPVSGWEIRDGDVVPLRSLPSVPAGTPPTEEGRWDLIPGCEHFSGTMAYRLRFTGDEGWATRPSALELAQVRYVAEAWLNEHPLGARLWPPYRWDTTGLIRPGQNELLVHVTNTLANAALKPEVMQQAKDRGWWNVYRERAQPMMEESLPSGVDPVVTILLGDTVDD